MQEKLKIVQNALSRQLAVYGFETQQEIMNMRVFLHGVTGLGVQVAKNLILTGPKQVVLYDKSIVSRQDVGRNFYCRESNIGKKTRAEACLPHLKDLNPSCSVQVSNSDQISYISSNFDCVVIVDHYNRNYLINLNKACRKNKVGFILCGNLGLYGYNFIDFGEVHKVFDLTGEQAKIIHIAGITRQEKATVYLHQDHKHGLNDGDTIQFKQVQGMSEINGKQFKVEVKTPESFFIGDTKKFSEYLNGGIATEIKMPVQMKFFDLQKSLRYPYAPDSTQMPITSLDKFGIPEQLHLILNGVYKFFAKYQRLPAILNEEQAQELVHFVNEFKNQNMQTQGKDFKVESVDQNLIKNVARFAQTQISPTTSFWGGIIAQEIIKYTGKYNPIRQWLHHQFLEVLPEGNVQRTINTQNRYNDYTVLFGDEFVQKCQNSRSFVIGAGALGCQFIKMFALMGASTQKKGNCYVADDNNIKISDLHRQFLFRQKNIGSNKSQTACKVGREINPASRFESIKLKFYKDTQEFFDEDFWTSLDFVVNAVNNIKTKEYVDRQCVSYEKPLFESETFGTKCHSQIIIPYQTLSYSDIIHQNQQILTHKLRIFPYKIEQTIYWARDFFQENISNRSHQLINYYNNSKQFLKQLQKQHKIIPSTLRSKLEILKKLYEANQLKRYQICVQLAVDIFQDTFNHQIAQLLIELPADHFIQYIDKPFWSGLKRMPQILEFNINDPLHLQFVQSAANIFATMFNIPKQSDKSVISGMVQRSIFNPFIPKIKIKTEQNNRNFFNQPDANEIINLNECTKLIKQLSAISINQDNTPTSIQYEKDDQNNWHIQFMSSLSNLRARNYKIQQVDSFKVKLIGGKITPAIIMTNAMVVGAVGIEIIKFLLKKPVSVYKNVQINLALPLWVFNDPLGPIMNEDKQFDPIMCGPIKAIPEKFTKWDKIDIKGPMTIQALKDHCQKTYNIQVSMITFGSATLYSFYGADSKKRLRMVVEQAIADITKKQFPKWKRFIPIGVSGNTKNGVDVLMPDFRYQVS